MACLSIFLSNFVLFLKTLSDFSLGIFQVTSWRLDNTNVPQAPPLFVGGFTSHTVIVVDRSGSMRKDDVPSFSTRTAAVYGCLAREFIQPQLDLTAGGTNVGRAVVTIVEFDDYAEARFDPTRHDMTCHCSIAVV